MVAEVARQFDVSTSLIYKWRREAQQPGPMFLCPPSWRRRSFFGAGGVAGWSCRRPGDPAGPASRTTVSIAATAPARLVLAVLRALR
ncbi:hypothetical protein [Devosia sp.]|uniref:hypothetical protein n=1 Tax=Devosia sp. TaxID=1871048 RepID=UPI0034224A89